MFVINDDMSIYVTRGDSVFFTVRAYEDGVPRTFWAGDEIRFKVFGKKDAENVVMQKRFFVKKEEEGVTGNTQEVGIYLDENDTKFGGVISKPVDYWYEVELISNGICQTIVGYDEDGPKVFRLMPEGRDLTDEEEGKPDIKPEDIPVVDSELDPGSFRPVQNQVIAGKIFYLEELYERTHAAVAEINLTPEMHGAIGDGVADDTGALQKAIDEAAEGFRYIRFATMGKYYVSDTLNVPDGVVIDFNHSTIETLQDIKVPAIRVCGNNVELRNLYLREKNPDGSDNTGLLVQGGGLSNINLSNIHTSGFMVGIEVTSADESMNKNVKVLNCSATKATSYGLFVSYCDGCYIENFNGCHNGLDGLKAGSHCSNVHVSGGEYSYNGIPASEGGSGYGDGIDLYAGGYKVKIIGATCKGNLGCGIHIMNGNYNLEGHADYIGCVVKDVIVSGCMIEDNAGNGVDAVVFGEAPNAPKPHNVIITSNCMAGNGTGVKLNAVDSVVSDNIIRDSADTGIYVSNSDRLSLANNTIINPAKQGIYVSNSRDITVSKGFIDGNGGAMQRAIMLDNKADDNATLIEDVVMRNYSESCPILVSNKSLYPNTKNVIKLHMVQEDTLVNYYGFSAGSMVVVDGKAYYKNTDNINKADFYKIPMLRCGTASLTGNGSNKVFNIAHGCGVKPDVFNVTPRMMGAAIPFTLQCDETNLIVQFEEALSSGSYSVNWNAWF